MSVQQLDAQAQAAGETAYNELMERAFEGDCSCETCVVREVLTAAYEPLLALARQEARAEAEAATAATVGYGGTATVGYGGTATVGYGGTLGRPA